MTPLHRLAGAALLASLAAVSCRGESGGGALTIGVAFETLQTEYWVSSLEAIRTELRARGYRSLESIADGDAARQFDQVQQFIGRRVAGIILVPKDARTVVPMIRAANRAEIPIVLFNRPPEPSDARSVTVVADNYAIAKDTVTYLAEQARATGRRHKAMILIGDLGDVNAVARRDGFDDALEPFDDVIDVVARVPTEWNQEKALAGVTNALQAHPDIGFIFTSSDFMLPSITSALKSAGKYHKVGEDGHVLLAGFDGDATAWRMLQEGYLDATGVQDLAFEAQAAVEALVDMREGRTVPDRILDPGFVIHQGNRDEVAPRMWGARVAGR